MIEGHVKLDQQFDRECARVMARRGVRQVEDGSYQFTRDLREVAVSALVTTVLQAGSSECCPAL